MCVYLFVCVCVVSVCVRVCNCTNVCMYSFRSDLHHKFLNFLLRRERSFVANLQVKFYEVICIINFKNTLFKGFTRGGPWAPSLVKQNLNRT
jgi:hypothetical protein